MMADQIERLNINRNTAFSQHLNNHVIVNIPFTDFDGHIARNLYPIQFGEGIFISEYIKDNYIDGGDTPYIVSGDVRLKIKDLDQNGAQHAGDENNEVRVPYSFPFVANNNLTNDELQGVVWVKLTDWYRRPHGQLTSNVYISGLSVNSFQLPANYKYHHRVKLYDSSQLRLKMMERITNIKMKNGVNCVAMTIFKELKKYYKKVTLEKVINQLNEFCVDVNKLGCSLDNFQRMMKKNYKYVSYDIIGPDFNSILSHNAYNEVGKTLLCINFYANNNHAYPINEQGIQKSIKQIRDGNGDIKKLFEELNIVNHYIDNCEYIESNDYSNLKEGVSYIINKDDNIKDVLCDMIKNENYGIEYMDMDFNTGKIKKFKHPTKDCMLSDYDDYHDRLKTFGILDKICNGALGKFHNKSFPVIGNTLINYIGKLPNSYYNKESFYYLNEYEIKPLCETNEYCNVGFAKGVDYVKQYATIFYKMFQKKKFYIPIYDIQDRICDYNGGEILLGEYYIEQCEYQNINFGGYFVHSYVVKKLLKMKIIKKKNIKKCIKASRYYKPDNFKKFIEILSELDEKSFKKISNYTNGTMKNSYNRKSKCHFTNDVNSLCYLVMKARDQGDKCTWNTNNETGYHFIKITSEKENYENTSSFYRSTLSCSLLQIMKLMTDVKDYGRIIKVQTDAIYYIPDDENNLFQTDVKNKDLLKSLGQITTEEMKNTFFENIYTCKEFNDYKPKRMNTLIMGCGGSGKTTKCILESDINEKILFLSTSNKAVLNLRMNSVKHGKKSDNWTFKTFALFFHNCFSYKSCLDKLNKYDKIIVDEVFMTEQTYIRKLLNVDTNIIFLGDPYQLGPIYDLETAEYCMIKKDLFRYCNKIMLEFRHDSGRYTAKSYKIFEEFKISGFKKTLNKINSLDHNKVYEFYICCTNESRRKYIKKCCDHFHKDGNDFIFIYQGKKETYKIGNGMPIICTKKDVLLDDKEITNNWIGILKEIKGDKYIISGIMNEEDNKEFEIDNIILKNNFLPFYSSTVHKFQGGNIITNYAIVDLEHNMCNKNSLYTSLTRCNDYKQIYIDHSKLKSRYYGYLYKDEILKLNDSKKELYILYELNFKCECNRKKSWCCIKKENQKISYEDVRPHNQLCQYDQKIIYKGELSYDQLNQIKKIHLEKNKVQKPRELGIYKELKERKGRNNTVSINENGIRFTYYINNVKNEMKIRTEKCGLDKGIEKLKEFVKDNKYKVSKVTNKTDKKFILEFN